MQNLIFNKLKHSPRYILFVRNFANIFYLIQDMFLFLYALLHKFGKLNDLKDKPLKIITACDSSHYLSAKQLIMSIKKYENNANIIFYDLGLQEDEIQEIKNMEVTYKYFNFNKYPNFINLKEKDAGAYAWKPQIIINELINEEGLTIWFDAGDKLTGNLNKIKIILTFYGFYSPLSNGYVEQWTHRSTLESLHISKKIYRKRMLNAAIIGINPKNIEYKNFIKSWSKLSLNKDLIIPEKSGKHNHRWDQSLLTIGFYSSFKKNIFVRTHKLFGVLTHQDIE